MIIIFIDTFDEELTKKSLNVKDKSVKGFV